MNRGPRGEERRRRAAAARPDRTSAPGDRANVPQSAVQRRLARRAGQANAPYASNWRAVLLADAGVGFAVFVIGVVLLFTVSVWIGAGIGALGASYDVLVLRRYRAWRSMRAEAGLDT